MPHLAYMLFSLLHDTYCRPLRPNSSTTHDMMSDGNGGVKRVGVALRTVDM